MTAKSSASSDRWYFCFLPIGIANGSISLLIPLFAKDLGASLAQVGLIAAGSSLASVPAFIIWGTLSDRLKRRKPFVIIGFLGMASCLSFMALSGNVEDFFISNLLFGFLVAASAPVGTVLIVETVSKEFWAEKLAAFSRMGGIGWVAGLILGAIWLQMENLGLTIGESMRGLFVIGAMLAILSSLLAWRRIVEPEEKVERKPLALLAEHHFITVERLKYLPHRVLHFLDLREYGKRTHRFSRALDYQLICIFLLFSGFTSFYAFFPIFLVDEVGLRSSEIFLIYIAAHATSVALYTRVGKWVHRHGGKMGQLVGSGARVLLFPAFMVITIVNIPLYGELIGIIALHSIVGLTWAFINVSGSVTISGLADPEIKGEAFGAYNAMQGFGAIAGPIAGGFISEFLGYAAGFYFASLFIMAGIVLLLRAKN